jgi:hypothetical protein
MRLKGLSESVHLRFKLRITKLFSTYDGNNVEKQIGFHSNNQISLSPLHLHLLLRLGTPLLPRKVVVILLKVDPLVAELFILLAPRA